MSNHDLLRLLVGVYIIGALAVFGRLLLHKIRFVRRGKPEDRSDQIPRRVWIFFSEVLGQSRVRERLAAGWAHALVFWGFLAFAVATADLLWRVAFGGGGILEPLGLTPFLLVVDVFAIAILVGVVTLAIRRYVVRPTYLTYYSRESAVVLAVIALIALSFVGERYAPAELTEYFGYAHLVFAFGFLAYVPTSKHFHILGAPVNAVVQPLRDIQKMDYLDLEAELDFDAGESYGWNRLNDFAWTDRLNLLTCIECGRCQEACPAHATGKLLNPRDFIVDLKYHAKGKTPQGEQARVALEAFQSSGESVEEVPLEDQPLEDQPLVDHVIASTTLWQCTTCMACVEACPVDIDHLSMLLNLRRYQTLDVGEIEPEYQRVFTNMERSGDPWGYGEHRKSETMAKLAENGGGSPAPRIAEPGESFDLLFWIGCWGLYDDRSVETTRATLKVLDHYGVDYRVLGDSELCCGENYRRMGNELQFQMNAQMNLELLGGVSFDTLMVTNPHCHQVFGKDYADFVEGGDGAGGDGAAGGDGKVGGLPFRVAAVEEVVNDLVREQGLPGAGEAGSVAYHDSCFYGRYNGLYDDQRDLVKAAGGKLVELERNRENGFCCGAGGGNFWREEQEPRVSWNRAAEVMKSGAPTLAVSCPFCLAMLEDGLKAQDGFEAAPVKVRHVVEIVADAIPGRASGGGEPPTSSAPASPPAPASPAEG